jgi:hypothetical protein
VAESAHSRERWPVKREIRVRGGCGGWVGGKAAIATAPPIKICVTPTKTGENRRVSKTAWLFRPEDLVKTKFIIIYCKSVDRAF